MNLKQLRTFLPSPVATLATGNVLSSLINLLGLPILSRIFSPAVFANLALFTSLGNIVLSFSTLKFEFALVRSGKRFEKLGFTGLALSANTLFAGISISAIFLLVQMGWLRIHTSSVLVFLLLLALYFLLNGIHQTLTHLALSRKDFRVLATTKILLASTFIAGALIPLNIGPDQRLVGAFTCSYLVVGVFLVVRFKKPLIFILKRRHRLPLDMLAKKSRNLSLFYLPSAFLDMLTLQMVPVVLYQFFPAAIPGAFFIAQKAVSIPSQVLGNAFSQYFFREAAEKHLNKQLRRGDFLNLWLKLFSVGIIPFTILIFFGKPVFTFILGDSWEMAGVLASWLAIKGLVDFLSSPTSSGFIVTGRENAHLYFSGARFIYVSLALSAAVLSGDFYLFLRIYVVAEVVLVIIYNTLMLRSL